MRLLLILISIFILSGCENKTKVLKDIPNTKVENEKAKAIFQRCQRCHGMKAEIAALTKSDIIAHYSKKDLIEALTLYQKGKRDRHRFGYLMKGIIVDLSSDDIRVLADYISKIEEKN
ncbi:cytochrome c [Sulfurimonas sp.]|uniref:c-type cytochrome n=1 Tax=Sulfurimonas sp. TaxID=2022749 RepID=UPI00356A3FFF